MMGEYLINSIPALDLAEKYGTPLFVYDTDLIKEKYQKLSDYFKGLDVHIHYACKANAAIEVLKILQEIGAGIDTVSPNEIKRALKTSFNKEDIIYTPSCPDHEHVRFALSHGIRIHFGAVEYLEIMGEELRGLSIGIRINPAVPVNGNQKVATASQRSKFGIPMTQIDRVRVCCQKYNIRVKTLHVHTGSGVSDFGALLKSIDQIFELAHTFEEVDCIDLGGGFNVSYYPGDEPSNLNSYAKHLAKCVKALGRPVKLILEPGKFLVAEMGYLLTKANIVKQGYISNFVGVNSGFHHLIRPMYYDTRHNIKNISNIKGTEKEYDVVGQLCEEDTFARSCKLNEVRVGDILCIENAGAYAYSMSMNYNLWERPPEVVIEGGKIRQISRDQIAI